MNQYYHKDIQILIVTYKSQFANVMITTMKPLGSLIFLNHRKLLFGI